MSFVIQSVFFLPVCFFFSSLKLYFSLFPYSPTSLSYSLSLPSVPSSYYSSVSPFSISIPCTGREEVFTTRWSECRSSRGSWVRVVRRDSSSVPPLHAPHRSPSPPYRPPPATTCGHDLPPATLVPASASQVPPYRY